MSKIDMDAGDDWGAFLEVCERMAGRKPTDYERDRLYDCWLSDQTCAESTMHVLGVVFDPAADLDARSMVEGLVHICTPMRTVDEMVRRARSEREIKQIIADAIGRPVQCIGDVAPFRGFDVDQVWVDELPNHPQGPYVPAQPVPVTGPSGWRGGRRAALWWVLLGLAGSVVAGFVVAGFVVATIAALVK